MLRCGLFSRFIRELLQTVIDKMTDHVLYFLFIHFLLLFIPQCVSIVGGFSVNYVQLSGIWVGRRVYSSKYSMQIALELIVAKNCGNCSVLGMYTNTFLIIELLKLFYCT